MDFFATIFGYVGIFLQLLLLFLIARGPFKRYFPLFLYVFTLLAVSSAEGYTFQRWGPDLDHYFPVYWGGELLLQLQLLLLVVTLTARALEGRPMRVRVMRFMVAVSVVIVVLPFVLFESRVFTTRWNDSASQLLNFGAAVLNLVLWGALVADRRRDRQLLTVSAGLGVAVASAAVVHGLRRFTAEDTLARNIADYSYQFLQTGSVVIWCWAFRPRRNPAAKTLTV